MKLPFVLKSGESAATAWTSVSTCVCYHGFDRLQLPGDLQREGERPAEEEIHADLQPEGPRAPEGRPVRGR